MIRNDALSEVLTLNLPILSAYILSLLTVRIVDIVSSNTFISNQKFN